MSTPVVSARIDQAQAILRGNDRGGYTVPTAQLYPFQWNWDSAFTALGLACFDRDRAWEEIAKLLSGQWDDGMVPHIIFHKPDPNYFPGPQVWQSGGQPATSGISQPPVLASVVWSLVADSNSEVELLRAQALFDALYRYHSWFHQSRDPHATGLSCITHPWESGRDNSPDWDDALARVSLSELPAYQRLDTKQVNSAQRPQNFEYDRYLSLVLRAREWGWDQQRIYEQSDFLVVDPCVQFILLRADKDLLRLAQKLSAAGLLAADDSRMFQLQAWIERSSLSCEQKLWNPEKRAFCAYDLRAQQFSPDVTSASMLCFYAGVGSQEQQRDSWVHAERILDSCAYAFPSLDPDSPRFEPQRYWRGPCWAMLNYLIADGFQSYGREDLAQRLYSDIRRLVELSGFYEYFDPTDGAGLGGGDFSWTAAIYLRLT